MGRNPNQNEAIKEQRRKSILSAALDLFSRKGLGATKVGDIAQKTGMSQGLLYHYYPSKEAIYVEIIRDAFAKLNAACRNLELSPLTPEDKITAALEALIDGLKSDPNAARYHVVIAQANLSDAVPDEAKQIIETESLVAYEVFERILRAGQKNGTVRDGNPAALATLFWTSIKGLAFHQAVWGKERPLPDATTLFPLFLES